MRKIIVIIMLIAVSIISFSDSDGNHYLKGRLIEKLSIEETPDSEQTDYVTYFKVKVNEGIDKGTSFTMDLPHYREEAYNIYLKKGDRIVLFSEIGEDGSNEYYITDKDKRMNILGLVMLFVGLTLFLGRLKGLRATLALFITILMILYFFIPGVIKGHSPILLSVITALLASIITIYFMTGLSAKGHVAVVGSFGGVALAGIISYIYVNKLSITGYTDLDSLNYAYLLGGIKVKELVPAGVILGSMGAVMDVAMSISSALQEVIEVDKTLSPKKIFVSGMNIGKDIIGTMVNTLVLAYVGSSLFTVMLLSLQKSEFPLIRILNFEFMSVEILRSICGSLGILITVPLTAYLASVFQNRKLNEDKELISENKKKNINK